MDHENIKKSPGENRGGQKRIPGTFSIVRDLQLGLGRRRKQQTREPTIYSNILSKKSDNPLIQYPFVVIPVNAFELVPYFSQYTEQSFNLHFFHRLNSKKL